MSSLSILLSDDVCDFVDHWRKKYDPYYRLWRPHISLVYPPFIPVIEWPGIRRHVVDALLEFKPFTITLDSVEVFEESPNILWLSPEDGGKMQRMRSRLEEALPQYVPVFPAEFKPHVTIGYFRKKKDAYSTRDEVQAEIDPRSQPLSWKVTQVVFLAQEEEGDMRFEDSVTIGKKC